ncbi:hypothetical protein B0H14DRAFT_2560125 [Mycena olivaceomarginata]|nr:hypothetical protein B0H14DRAFT_2560125 [Mycena olivaceomarginata]
MSLTHAPSTPVSDPLNNVFQPWIKKLRSPPLLLLPKTFQDLPAVHNAKILVNILQVGNQVNAIVVVTPEYQVSASLEKTLHNFAAAILLSSRISAYKGAVPTNTLLIRNILRKNRFDLPQGIENKPADYSKVVASMQDAFIPLRSKFKKALSTNLKVKKQDKEHTPGPKHQNIFKLTGIFVENTRCSVTIKLCARVTLMRQVYLVCPVAFLHILTRDQDLHSIKTNDPEIPQSDVDGFQQEVNDLIDTGLNDVATSVVAQVALSTPTAQQAGGTITDD